MQEEENKKKKKFEFNSYNIISLIIMLFSIAFAIYTILSQK